MKNNKINLCDSCQNIYPECDGSSSDLLFGDGKGNDNIICCRHYKPFPQSPPLWKECPECKGRKYTDNCEATQEEHAKENLCDDCDDMVTCNVGEFIPCNHCHQGKIPIYYTPEQWIKWHQENGQPDYELHKDLIVRIKCHKEWTMIPFNCLSELKEMMGVQTVIMYHPDQPGPPADYRP